MKSEAAPDRLGTIASQLDALGWRIQAIDARPGRQSFVITSCIDEDHALAEIAALPAAIASAQRVAAADKLLPKYLPPLPIQVERSVQLAISLAAFASLVGAVDRASPIAGVSTRDILRLALDRVTDAETRGA